MKDEGSTRRRFVHAAGASAVFALAGCSSDDPGSTDTEDGETPTEGTESPTATDTGNGSAEDGGPRNGDDLPEDTNPRDGYPPEFESVPEERDIDTDSFETLDRSDQTIKLVPTDVAYYWYARGEARFADTRSESEFEVSHVFGSVLSPAGDGVDLPDDPVLEWPQGDRIVTYCDCPHHLASLRAASLMSRGYEEVYAIDEGFGGWRDRDFPLAGEDVGRSPEVRVIEGQAPQRHESEFAWAYHENSDQREATPIQGDGSYELRTKFVDVDGESSVRVETPAYEVTATFDELTAGTISEDGEVPSSDGTATNGTANGTENGTETDSDDDGGFDLRSFLG